LLSDEERKNSSRLPGIGDIPLLGRLFSNQVDRKNKTEIVLAITPRVISNLNLPNAYINEYWSGTENEILDKPNTKMPVQSQTKSPRELWLDRNRSVIRNGIRPDEIQPEQAQPEQAQPEPEQIPASEKPQPITIETTQPALQNTKPNTSN
jgi:general secretion pathway protein D